MLGRPHLIGGLLAGQLTALYLSTPTNTPVYPVLLVSAAFGGILPDIDCPTAAISKATLVTKGVSGIICSIFKHRGFLHTPLFAALFFFLAANVNDAYALYALVGIGTGYVSHLILDTFNAKGIMWLFPISTKHLHIAKIKTGENSEFVFKWVLIGCNMLALMFTIGVELVWM